MKKGKILFALTLAFASHVVSAACSGYQNPPAGIPDNFDINEHLRSFDSAGQAISRLPPGGPFGQTAVRASIMTSMFYSGRKYDLKNNPSMRSSEQFGNWFFGAAAAQMGYTKTEALRAGAVVQQWQNFGYTNHPASGDLGVLAKELALAVLNSNNDNPGDGLQISGGYDYSEEAYDKDPDSSSNANSCNRNEPTKGAQGGGGGYGYGGGWGGGFFIGAGCYGNCGANVIKRTTIRDLPPDQPK